MKNACFLTSPFRTSFPSSFISLRLPFHLLSFPSIFSPEVRFFLKTRTRTPVNDLPSPSYFCPFCLPLSSFDVPQTKGTPVSAHLHFPLVCTESPPPSFPFFLFHPPAPLYFSRSPSAPHHSDPRPYVLLPPLLSLPTPSPIPNHLPPLPYSTLNPFRLPPALGSPETETRIRIPNFFYPPQTSNTTSVPKCSSSLLYVRMSTFPHALWRC